MTLLPEIIEIKEFFYVAAYIIVAHFFATKRELCFKKKKQSDKFSIHKFCSGKVEKQIFFFL